MNWSVSFQVVRDARGSKELMGLRIMLFDGEDEEYEIARVAFRREDSANPDKDFATALDEQLDKAEQAIEVINDFEDQAERDLQDAKDKARNRIREILDHEEVLE